MGCQRSITGVNTIGNDVRDNPLERARQEKIAQESKKRYSQKKKAYMKAKAALSALVCLYIDSDDESNKSPSE
jgi:hypothetical protein